MMTHCDEKGSDIRVTTPSEEMLQRLVFIDALVECENVFQSIYYYYLATIFRLSSIVEGSCKQINNLVSAYVLPR